MKGMLLTYLGISIITQTMAVPIPRKPIDTIYNPRAMVALTLQKTLASVITLAQE